MITLHNVKKTYNKGLVTALKDISFAVNHGELFGLIGPDGAGKTTLFRILTTLLLADEGTATVNGFDVLKDYKQIRNCVGYMPSKFSLYQDLTVEENLHFFATIFDTTIQENYALIKDIYQQIEPFKNRMAGKLSGGMKRRLMIARALVHEPQLLILDEPTRGIDVGAKSEIYNIMNQLLDQGILCIIMISSELPEILGMSDRILVMHNGKISGDILQKNANQETIMQYATGHLL